MIASHPYMGAWIETSIKRFCLYVELSHPYMGAWIETSRFCELVEKDLVAPLHGCVDWNWFIRSAWFLSMSHPYMGAWIETAMSARAFSLSNSSHPYMGAWIETYPTLLFSPGWCGRTLTWVRGLKRLCHGYAFFGGILSHPYMGAWIETANGSVLMTDCQVAPLHGCVDWNGTVLTLRWIEHQSHPYMGAWIETILETKL